MGDIVEGIVKMMTLYKYEISQKGTLLRRVIEKETAGHKKFFLEKKDFLEWPAVSFSITWLNKPFYKISYLYHHLHNSFQTISHW